jgi:predicted N-acetyltransferase YhbS
VTRYEPRLDDARVAEAAANNHALWGAGRTLEEHVAYNREQLRRAGPEILRCVGLVDDHGALVASIKRYGLALSIDGRPERAVGIGAVFTPAAHRKKGLAARLVGEVLREAEEHGYAAALLYSDIDPAYYARLGFVALDASEHEADAGALPADGALDVRPLGDDDLAWLLDLRARSLAGRTHLHRSRALHRFFTWRNAVSGAYALRDGPRDVGYLLATRDDPSRDLPELVGDSLWVDEWAAPGVDRARVLATVRALAQRAGVRRVRAWLPPELRGAPFTSRAREEALPMIAPLNGVTIDVATAFLGSFEHF